MTPLWTIELDDDYDGDFENDDTPVEDGGWGSKSKKKSKKNKEKNEYHMSIDNELELEEEDEELFFG
jgi:hypothetical protein